MRNIAKKFKMTMSLIDIETIKPRYKCFFGEDVELCIKVVDEDTRPVDLTDVNAKVYYTCDNFEPLRQDNNITINEPATNGTINILVNKKYLRLGVNTIRVALFDSDQEVLLQPCQVNCIETDIGDEHGDVIVNDDINVKDEFIRTNNKIDRVDGRLKIVECDVPEIKRGLANVNEQLDTNANEIGLLKTAMPNKADITYVNNKVATMSSGTPLFAPSKTEMTDTTKNYVNTTDGYLYTYSNSDWIKTSILYQSSGIGDNTIVPRMLSVNYDNIGNVASGVSVNTITSTGVYLVLSGALDMPSDFTSGLLVVKNISNRWIIQELHNLTYGKGVIYARSFDKSNPTSWNNVKQLEDNVVTTSKIKDSTVTNSKFTDEFNYVKTLGNSDNINNIVKSGDYLISGSPSNMPTGFSGTVGRLTVSQIGGRWIEQKIREHSNLDKYWIRQLDKEHLDYNISWNLWEKGSSLPLNGEICVHFGDSITGNYTAPNDYPTVVANKTGMTTYNVGFGGAKMSSDGETTPFDAFCMVKLADAIVSKDFSYQDANVNGSGIPSYYATTLARLKGIDFTRVKYITIFYGTNDFRLWKKLDNESDLKDITTFGGALRYSLEKIQTAYPHIRILLITPWYRYFFSDGVITGDSDTQQWNNYYLWQFVDKEIEIAKDFKVSVLDMYRTSGVNKFNRDTYFLESDGTHPNTTYGIPLIGGKIASFILGSYR